MKNFARFMGVIWIITSLSWVACSIAGLFYGLRWLENLESNLEGNVVLIVDSLDAVKGIMTEATDVVSSTQTSLASIQLSVHDASIALSDARPLLWKTTKVVTTDVPDALDGVQESMPSLVETAKSVDETLTWLSGIGFTVPIPFGEDRSFDLGIDYAPEVPLDQALENMSSNLEGVPDDLRDMEESLNAADENLVVVSDDLALLASDLDSMNKQIADVNPQLDLLTNNIEDLQASFLEIEDELPQSLDKARKIMMSILVLLMFTQLPSIFMGWVLASGRLWLPEAEKESS